MSGSFAPICLDCSHAVKADVNPLFHTRAWKQMKAATVLYEQLERSISNLSLLHDRQIASRLAVVFVTPNCSMAQEHVLLTSRDRAFHEEILVHLVSCTTSRARRSETKTPSRAAANLSPISILLGSWLALFQHSSAVSARFSQHPCVRNQKDQFRLVKHFFELTECGCGCSAFFCAAHYFFR